MSIKTQNAIKLFMDLQTVRSSFDPGTLPMGLETDLNSLIHKCDLTITIRKGMKI